MKTHLEELLRAAGGVIALRDHPELLGQLRWLVRTGELVRVLPGVYAVPRVATHPDARRRAVPRWSPDAVITGRAAARLTFWPTLTAPVTDLAQVEGRPRAPGFRCSERRIPVELITTVDGLRLTVPALTALDLCAELGGEPIDQVLRTRRAPLVELHRALELCPGRDGNRRRRRLLLESRDEPWSEAERLAHVLVRAAGITGWKANHATVVGGQRYYIDIAFPAIRLAIEIDGREFHSDPEVFEADRRRQNALVGAGWRVLRFTWRMLQDDPEAVLLAIRRELRARGRVAS